MASNTQINNAIRLYEARGLEYDASWHPDFTKRFFAYLDITPSQHILDLACGTGLLTFLAADAVGSHGRVVGVDVTPGMLAQAKAKKEREPEKYRNVELFEGNVLSLETIKGVDEGSFDVITMASAIVLFPDPKAAVKYWTKFLKPGGVLAIDSTHPKNLIVGRVLEITGRKMGLDIPYYREWSTSENTLAEVLESANLRVRRLATVDNQRGEGTRFHQASDAEEIFEKAVTKGDAPTTFKDESTRGQAKAIFKEEWMKLAVGGKVEEVDAVFLGIAQKINDDTDVVFSGGCRCGQVKYTSYAQPKTLVFCHCRACGHLSGSGYLPFMELPSDGIKFEASSALTTLKLSASAERTFCSSCGSPITMVYRSETEITAVTAGSVDEDTFNATWPKVTKHIFVKEKAPWVTIPDDGAQRLEAFH